MKIFIIIYQPFINFERFKSNRCDTRILES